MINTVLDGLLGVCVGDALGTPFEFRTRKYLEDNPVKEMQGYGTYNMPPGTWSDDTAMTLCLAESLCHGFNLEDIAKNFCRWLFENYWTPYGKVFDIGATTREGIIALKKGINPVDAGSKEENSNGNGSLMRTLPLAYYLQNKSNILDIVHQVSCLTHGHPRSQMSCGIYVLFAISLLKGRTPAQAYSDMQNAAYRHYEKISPYREELPHFARILRQNIAQFPQDTIRSGCYVVDTLEASLWCLLNSASYKETVLKAINLGSDTDTTGAVAGGLAGISYGWKTIPQNWIDHIARKDDIFELARRFQDSLKKAL